MSALSQGMGGLALILSFALLCSRRIDLALAWIGGQALIVSIAIAARQDIPAAISNAVVSGLLVPLLLRQICDTADRSANGTGDRKSLPATLVAAGALSLLAVQAGMLGLPLAVLLLGLLLVATRRSPEFQAFGLCSMQQAALLAAGSDGHASPALALSLAVPVLPALAAAGLWFGQAGPDGLKKARRP